MVVLATLAAWVASKGRHPEPGLYGQGPELTRVGEVVNDGGVGVGAAATRNPAAQASVFPDGLAPEGWATTTPARFDPESMYEKIDGRADYYLSLGCRSLATTTLTDPRDPTRAIDVELFDMGQAASALGAYGGERAEGVEPQVGPDGLWHRDRNAMFATKGRFYLRVIGSDEDEATTDRVAAIGERMLAALDGEPLPWSYALFVAKLGISPAHVSYEAENAFSLSAARDVHVAQVSDDGAELFVMARQDGDDAARVADELRVGFLEYGEAAGESDGIALVKDRYLDTLTAVGHAGPWAFGVRGAADRAAALAQVHRLRQSLSGLVLPAPLPAMPPESPPASEPGAPPEALEENTTESAYNSGEPT